MRQKLLYVVLLFTFCIVSSQRSDGAFIVKNNGKALATMHTRDLVKELKLILHAQNISNHLPAKARRLDYSLTEDDKQKGGAWGILAIICAFTFVLAPFAVIFGAIGAGRHCRNSSLARVALVIGCIETIIIFLILSSMTFTIQFGGPMSLGLL